MLCKFSVVYCVICIPTKANFPNKLSYPFLMIKFSLLTPNVRSRSLSPPSPLMLSTFYSNVVSISTFWGHFGLEDLVATEIYTLQTEWSISPCLLTLKSNCVLKSDTKTELVKSNGVLVTKKGKYMLPTCFLCAKGHTVSSMFGLCLHNVSQFGHSLCLRNFRCDKQNKTFLFEAT